MSYQPTITLNANQAPVDPGGRIRTSVLTTLGDYKILEFDKTLLFETTGSGTGSFEHNAYRLTVSGSNQWMARRTRKIHPYFSGKPQFIEVTFDNFHVETDVVKKVGYYSTSTTIPFSDTEDGFYIKASGSTHYLVVQNSGSLTLELPKEQWDNYESISSYNWKNFTVIIFDFLWLGGAILRLWIKGADGFKLLHTYHYAGTREGTFIKYPTQPLRCDIRSTGGNGMFRYICAQIATEGGTEEAGISRAVDTGTNAISIATVGTVYPLIAIRKNANYRHNIIEIQDLGVFVSSVNDIIRWSLHINPTFSAPLSFTPLSNSALETAIGNGTITVTAVGTVIASGYISTNALIPNSILQRNYLRTLTSTIDGNTDIYVLCATPATSTISSYASLLVKEY